MFELSVETLYVVCFVCEATGAESFTLVCKNSPFHRFEGFFVDDPFHKGDYRSGVHEIDAAVLFLDVYD